MMQNYNTNRLENNCHTLKSTINIKYLNITLDNSTVRIFANSRIII